MCVCVLYLAVKKLLLFEIILFFSLFFMSHFGQFSSFHVSYTKNESEKTKKTNSLILSTTNDYDYAQFNYRHTQ